MNVRDIYNGSDGEATKALYARLSTFGPIGDVALNLFRAQKASTRAKVYRGGVPGRGSYKRMAYDRKNWAMENLCATLAQHASSMGLVYGWQRDDDTGGYPWVLYVDLPTGQVSFHAPSRGLGPDYPGIWDGVRNVSADRIVRWCELVVAGGDTPPVQPTTAPRWTWCGHCKAHWANRRTCPVHPSTLLVEKPVVSRRPELRPGTRAEWDEESRV